jgi:uncharacterized protein
MDHIYNDDDYIELVKDILSDQKFTKTKYNDHHGFSKFDHSLKVSYYSYKIAKKLKLSYIETARAGLLHDFFLSDNRSCFRNKFLSNFRHAKEARDNAKEKFKLSPKEEDIIITHMFPLNIIPPKYLESWIVTTVDKFVATNEFLMLFKFKTKLATNLFLIFLFNSLK